MEEERRSNLDIEDSIAENTIIGGDSEVSESSGVGTLIIGIIMLLGGIALTAGSGGETLYYGAMIVGVINIIVGGVKMIN